MEGPFLSLELGEELRSPVRPKRGSAQPDFQSFSHCVLGLFAVGSRSVLGVTEDNMVEMRSRKWMVCWPLLVLFQEQESAGELSAGMSGGQAPAGPCSSSIKT